MTKLTSTLFIVGMSALIIYQASFINKLRLKVSSSEIKILILDKKIDCLVNMQWKQDENAIKIYNGMEPDWQGRQYPEVPECEGVL
jgi:hypothetical protein